MPTSKPVCDECFDDGLMLEHADDDEHPDGDDWRHPKTGHGADCGCVSCNEDY